MFGHRAVKKILEQSAGLSASAIKDRLLEAANQHYGNVPHSDDMALIVAKMK